MDMEISGEYSGSNNDQSIVKRKRSKRQRLSISATSSGGGATAAEFYNSSIISSSSSPTTSSGNLSTSTEEDEDMANCLILLARGGGFSDDIKPPEIKFSSRKFTEMATTTNAGKIGIYVYECKTCSRTFPSFQALGGHRTSHKKPKTAADNNDRKRSPPPPPLIDDHEEELGGKFAKLNTITPPPSTQLVNKNSHGREIKPKIHECSICGSEFASGQALGGHMRRHRSSNANPRSVNVNEATPPSDDGGDRKTRNVLVLDLNLPAPISGDTDFHEFSASPPRSMVFSATALVDCHY